MGIKKGVVVGIEQNTVAAFWEELERCTLQGAPARQRVEMRRAFYSGVGCLMTIQQSLNEKGASDEGFTQVMSNVYRELELFSAALTAAR